MTAVPAASYLTDFRGEREVLAGPAFVPFGRGHHPHAGAAADAVPARIEAARAGGFAAGEAAARSALEGRLAQEREAWACEREALREAWARTESEKFAQRLAAGIGEIEARIAQGVGRVLEPFLQAELRRRAVAELEAELRALLDKDAAIRVSIAGPADLLDALRERLADRFPSVTYIADGEPDVRILADHTILKTRLAAWAARLREAVG